jgi:hypothetical protein
MWAGWFEEYGIIVSVKEFSVFGNLPVGKGSVDGDV